MKEQITQFWGTHQEHVSIDALMPHREYEHGPGYSQGINGQRFAAKRTPEQWNALVGSIRSEGVREPVTFAYSPRDHAGYLAEGNSRLAAAREAGHQTVPVIGYRVSEVPDNPAYKLTNQPELARGR